MKYKKISIMNQCAQLAKSLNVKFRCSDIGISIIDSDGVGRFFHIDFLYRNSEDCKKYIKKVAHPSLQTTLL